MKVGNSFFAQDDRAGALPTLYAATQDLPCRRLAIMQKAWLAASTASDLPRRRRV
jgi:hypothetical protein